MTNFIFTNQTGDQADPNAMGILERQLRPVIDDIAESAVAAGWKREDVLLTLVELTWNMYEDCRSEP